MSLFQTSLPIAPNDIDFANRLKPSALFTYLQSAAAAHAEQLQLGYQDMQTAGLFWVLAWVRLEMTAYPHYRDTIAVQTWPYNRQRLYSLRDIIFSTHQGQVFGRARSAWLVVNMRTKRITNHNNLPHPVPYEPHMAALEALPEKINPGRASEPVGQRQVGYSDLDINQHVNNAKYIEYVLDCYPLEFHRLHALRSITIAFQSEARFGDRLILSRQTGNRNKPHQLGCHQARDGKSVFQALVAWQPTQTLADASQHIE